MAFLPVAASKEITKKYKRYLRTIFEINDPEYQRQFENLLKSDIQFSNGPYLDVTKKKKKGHSISVLIEEGLLPKGISKLNIELERPLYFHQEQSIRRVLSGNNIVVSTGTGSGKTESFLLPILSEIIKEHEEGTLSSGVRALLIYPMNALANDQMERLRYLLSDYPEITFGAYIGQTSNDYNTALAEYKSLNDGKVPASNELISRTQMKSSPPHILITNYAMLEYLMVRPDDQVFFRKEDRDKWKYIVLDEAHVYSGSTGIEVSMLLRRLRATLHNDRIKYILTSATLGDEESNKEVAEFASNLCDAPFSSSDVVRASRVNALTSETNRTLPIEFYRELGDELLKDERDNGAINSILMKYTSEVRGGEALENVLFDLLSSDNTFIKVKDYLSEPRKISDVSAFMEWSEADSELFVIVASLAEKNAVKLFDSRYHMFLRATESVFITLGDNKKLFLERRKTYFDGNKEKKVFEIATCSFCHSIYIVGKIIDDKLEQYNNLSYEDGGDLFLLGNSIEDATDEDVIDEQKYDLEPYDLCPECGYIRLANVINGDKCGHDESNYVRVWKVNKEKGTLKKCPACETANPYSVVRMFFTGQEAVTSVIGTALFEELPSYKITYELNNTIDDSGFDFGDYSTSVAHKTKEAKQFIAFSDSRQAAAFYASYMDKTYSSILYKRLILEALKNGDGILGKPMPLFVDNLTSLFEKNEICGRNTLPKKEAWKAILAELVDNNGNTSLYNMGLLDIGITDDILMPDNKKWSLSVDEVRTICNEFVLTMLSNAAVTVGDSVALTKEDNEAYTHGGVLSSFTYSDTDTSRRRKAFIPSKAGLSNKRIDYISKIAKKVGLPSDQDSCKTFLSGIWNIMLINSEKEILIQNDGAYQVNAKKMTFRRNSQWYICPKCRKITSNNVKGVCPTYRCDGELQQIDIEEHFRGNHYYEMYQSLEIRPLRIVEHTAQLDRKKAYEYQKEFKNKEIDVLSCSTTFEMGVDVGTLETVFMRNMPPSPSNYAQRAGRAGRSIKSAAFALTFCNKSNHDFTFFNSPIRMIKGKILPPSFNVNNEKIAIRHIYASAMAYFWRNYPEYFKTAKAMLGDGRQPGQSAGIESFINYIESKPEDLKQFIKDFLPDSLIDIFGVEDFGWVSGLVDLDGSDTGLLTQALREYDEELKMLLEEEQRTHEELRGNNYLVQRINTYYNEPILAFLARKGVFPRYGFPVDTVDLNIPSNVHRDGVFGLQLQRDLAMAISEYAPGSQVVANDNLITSRYIKKAPSMLWKMYDYRVCSNCRSMNLKPHLYESDNVQMEDEEFCSVCGNHLTGLANTFLIPEWGFIADGNSIAKPGLVKPERTFNNEIAYVGKGDGELIDISLPNTKISMIQSAKDEMAVINSSRFFVCRACGYTEVDKDCFRTTKSVEHRTSYGSASCVNKRLYRYSLGYRFSTSVLQIRFEDPCLDIIDWNYAYSVLQGFIRGFCSYYSIDERDISGCLQYFISETTGNAGYSIVLYDSTPGGSGYVKMLRTAEDLKAVLNHSFEIVSKCTCGGESGDSSCYSCLRNYYNQRSHDLMKRSYVIDFIKRILG